VIDQPLTSFARNITADPRMAIAKLRAVMNSKLFILQRVERLVSTMLNGSRAWSPEDAPVFQKLALSVKDLSVHFQMDELSKRILLGFEAKFAVGNAESNTMSREAEAFQHASDEKCRICEAEVNWLNSSEAACTNAHQFGKKLISMYGVRVQTDVSQRAVGLHSSQFKLPESPSFAVSAASSI
jgi:Putative zinc-finger of transcription factor IIIC complex